VETIGRFYLASGAAVCGRASIHALARSASSANVPPLASAAGVGYFVRMTRRRVILAACVAVVAMGAAWWLFFTGMTAEEYQLVGKWQVAFPPYKRVAGELEFRDNRKCHWESWTRPGIPGSKVESSATWRLSGNELAFDNEPSFLLRLLRPTAKLTKLKVSPVSRTRLDWVSADRIERDSLNGREVWTRDRGD
jgi:hypothetical protein